MEVFYNDGPFKGQTAYQILGFKEKPTNESPDIYKKAYRKLAHQCHPDLYPGDKDAKEKFQALNWAYEILSNPSMKEKYDTEYDAELSSKHFSRFIERLMSDFRQRENDILKQFPGEELESELADELNIGLANIRKKVSKFGKGEFGNTDSIGFGGIMPFVSEIYDDFDKLFARLVYKKIGGFFIEKYIIFENPIFDKYKIKIHNLMQIPSNKFEMIDFFNDLASKLGLSVNEILNLWIKHVISRIYPELAIEFLRDVGVDASNLTQFNINYNLPFREFIDELKQIKMRINKETADEERKVLEEEYNQEYDVLFDTIYGCLVFKGKETAYMVSENGDLVDYERSSSVVMAGINVSLAKLDETMFIFPISELKSRIIQSKGYLRVVKFEGINGALANGTQVDVLYSVEVNILGLFNKKFIICKDKQRGKILFISDSMLRINVIVSTDSELSKYQDLGVLKGEIIGSYFDELKQKNDDRKR